MERVPSGTRSFFLYLFFRLCYISPGHSESRHFALHVVINPVANQNLGFIHNE
jgi:hypothetical protein